MAGFGVKSSSISMQVIGIAKDVFSQDVEAVRDVGDLPGLGFFVAVSMMVWRRSCSY
jgi:hypothetical protein